MNELAMYEQGVRGSQVCKDSTLLVLEVWSMSVPLARGDAQFLQLSCY